MVDHELYQRVLNLYSPLGFRTRAFVWGRLMIAPFLEILKYVPQEGTVLDVGCGYGIFSNLLSLSSPSRQVIGLDISEDKIAVAQKTVAGRRNIHFVAGETSERLADPNICDAIVMIDLIHHVPYEGQARLIRWSYRRLATHAMLIVKDVDTQPIWKHWCSYLHDIVVNHAWGRLFFVSSETLEGMLRESGFAVQHRVAFRSSPYAHVLYVCVKEKGVA